MTVCKGTVVRPTADRRGSHNAEAPGLRSTAAYYILRSEVSKERGEIVEQFRPIKGPGGPLSATGLQPKRRYCSISTAIDYRTIDYVVDRNPAKQGRIIPGTGILVEPVERLNEEHPDVWPSCLEPRR